jgi:hypothetical protein
MTKYTLLLNGSIRNNETGSIIPGNRSTHLGNQAILELAASGCASEDVYGLVSFTPDSILLDQEQAVVDTLDQAKAKAYAIVDTEAGNARLKYITSIPGQDATYLAKANEANKYAANGYDLSTLSQYVWLIAECNALGVATDNTADHDAVKAAVDGIISEQTSWYYIGSKIEELRRSTKIKISNETGTTKSRIATAKANIQNYVDNAVTLFKAM